MELQQLQIEVGSWVEHNFGKENSLTTAIDNLLGIQEEVGELSHSILKHKQGVRTTEPHMEKAQDAIGDIVIYMAAFCHRIGFDFNKCVTTAWNEVKDRDWIKYPEKGVPPEESHVVDLASGVMFPVETVVPLYHVEVRSAY